MKSILSISLALVLFVLAPGRSVGQDVESLMTSAIETLNTGAAHGDQAAIKQAAAMFERASADPAYAVLAHYYLGFAGYRMAGMFPDKDNQLEHLDQGIDHLEKAIELDDQFAEGYALLGSMMGWKAGLKPMMSMVLGPRSTSMISKSAELDPVNPRIVMFRAISDYNTPAMFGGDKERAKEGFEEAIRIFAEEPAAEGLAPDWGEEEAYAWLGQAHMADEAYDKAEKAFTKALEINPDYGWVKHVLMPQLKAAQ